MTIDQPGANDRTKGTNDGLHPVDNFMAFEQPDYRDDAGNIWRITVRGQEDVVKAFREKGQFHLLAREISEEERKQQLDKWQSTKQNQDNPRPQAKEAPSFEFYAVLAEGVPEGKHYLLSYKATIPIAGHSVHTHTLFSGDDGIAFCSFTAQGQAIVVVLGDQVGVGLNGAVSAPSSLYATWQVTVWRDEQTSYDLAGDAIVPQSA